MSVEAYQILHRYSADDDCWVTVFSDSKNSAEHKHGPDSESFDDCCIAFNDVGTIEEFIGRCFHLEQQTAGTTFLNGQHIVAKNMMQTDGNPVHLDQITLK